MLYERLMKNKGLYYVPRGTDGNETSPGYPHSAPRSEPGTFRIRSVNRSTEKFDDVLIDKVKKEVKLSLQQAHRVVRRRGSHIF
jgi:hypothetical protein